MTLRFRWTQECHKSGRPRMGALEPEEHWLQAELASASYLAAECQFIFVFIFALKISPAGCLVCVMDHALSAGGDIVGHIRLFFDEQAHNSHFDSVCRFRWTGRCRDLQLQEHPKPGLGFDTELFVAGNGCKTNLGRCLLSPQGRDIIAKKVPNWPHWFLQYLFWWESARGARVEMRRFWLHWLDSSAGTFSTSSFWHTHTQMRRYRYMSSIYTFVFVSMICSEHTCVPLLSFIHIWRTGKHETSAFPKHVRLTTPPSHIPMLWFWVSMILWPHCGFRKLMHEFWNNSSISAHFGAPNQPNVKDRVQSILVINIHKGEY